MTPWLKCRSKRIEEWWLYGLSWRITRYVS